MCSLSYRREVLINTLWFLFVKASAKHVFVLMFHILLVKLRLGLPIQHKLRSIISSPFIVYKKDNFLTCVFKQIHNCGHAKFAYLVDVGLFYLLANISGMTRLVFS